ncbi:MAG: alpha/beta fold hydrolase [Halieaceae bacterium]|jgi:alpha-beta hydrolase superfamily lysophospholipase|nr:alpha/beta fold hydrolase [Halieaceae bacterium]
MDRLTAERFDVSEALDLAQAASVCTDLFMPSGPAKALVVCLPGGGCNRTYFDLQVDSDKSYSCARFLCAKGYAVCTVDHLGVGDSTRPEDGYAVTTRRVLAASHELVTQLRRHTIPEIVASRSPSAAAQDLPVYALGHSMGAFLAIKQQFQFADYDALGLLGFGHQGLPDLLSDLGKELAARPDDIEHREAELGAAQYGAGYFEIPPQTPKDAADPRAAALLACSTPVIATVGATVLIPGASLRESRSITCPVFVANGSRDMAGSAALAASAYTNSRSVTEFEIPDAGHMHFLSRSRQLLFKRLATWLETLSA